MTTNKPEVVAFIDVHSGHGRRYVSLKRGVDHYSLTDGESLVRLSDYEALQAELKHAKEWRDLAIQFDHHRMRAIALLRARLAGSATSEDCHTFLSAPPLSALEITEAHEALQSECEKLRRDAERYRFLRADALSAFESGLDEPQLVFARECVGDYQDCIDAATDAAMEEAQP